MSYAFYRVGRDNLALKLRRVVHMISDHPGMLKRPLTSSHQTSHPLGCLRANRSIRDPGDIAFDERIEADWF